MNKDKKPLNIEIGKKLRLLRLKKDVTEGEVAKAIHRNPSTYSRIENGTSELSDSLAELLADYFEVDIHEIKTPKPNIYIENSYNEACNDAISSGNINSSIEPSKEITELIDLVNKQLIQHQKIMAMIIKNQQTILGKGI
jgi:transcriptional regulator with XRE-family HTH domain